MKHQNKTIMNTIILKDMQIAYYVYPSGVIATYSILMETEQSYFVRRINFGDNYYEIVLNKSDENVFTDYDEAIKYKNRNENKV